MFTFTTYQVSGHECGMQRQTLAQIFYIHMPHQHAHLKVK